VLAAAPAHWIIQIQAHIPPAMVLCYYINNCCEALIGAGCVGYFILPL
jgi:hypothetical protein